MSELMVASPIARFFLRPRVNLCGAGLSIAAEIVSWFTTFDDAYRVTPVAFVLSVFFVGLFALHEHLTAEQLRATARPRLRLIFDPSLALCDSIEHGQRSFRVGIINTGESVSNVAVKLARIHPEVPHIYPMQELQQIHAGEGTSRFTVNGSNEPLIYVGLLRQSLFEQDGQRGNGQHVRKGETASLWFRFAGPGRGDLPIDRDQYLLWLAIDGAGAGKQLKLALKKNAQGQYDMYEAFA